MKPGLSDKDVKLLEMCIRYSDDAFGAPNHSLMVLVARLFTGIPKVLVPLLTPCSACGEIHNLDGIEIQHVEARIIAFCKNAGRFVWVVPEE